MSATAGLPGPDALQSLFDHARPPTFGAEEEVMLLDRDSFDLAPRASELLEDIDGDWVKLELPASQLELVTERRSDVRELVEDLHRGRTRIREEIGGKVGLAAAGAHPFAPPECELNGGAPYERVEQLYGPIARRQLVCGLHVHVGLGNAERVLAVYNAMRSYLPLLAALGANAPLYGGGDCGLASVRPFISGLLPRQGVPPIYRSWQELSDDLSWGERAGRLEGVRGWWWELRIHAVLGTLEVRVPDAQSTVDDAAAIVTMVCALVLWLAAQHDADALPAAAPSWRIAENRWSAARYGLAGEMVDLRKGARVSTRERVHALLELLEPTAARLGVIEHLRHGRRMAELGGAERQRMIVAERGPSGLMRHLAESFAAPLTS